MIDFSFYSANSLLGTQLPAVAVIRRNDPINKYSVYRGQLEDIDSLHAFIQSSILPSVVSILSTLSNCSGLFHSLCRIELNRSVGLKGLNETLKLL